MSETQTEGRFYLLRSVFTEIFVDVFKQKSIDSATFKRIFTRKTQDVHDIFASEENRTLTNVLVDAAEQIFDAYQVQIFTATYGKVLYRDHLRALSKIAKLKCFNYIHKNFLSVDKQYNITSCLIVEGVLNGRLSRESQNKLFASCDDDLQIKCPLIFEKTGLLLKSRTNQRVIEYYSRSDGSNNTNVYGYRTEVRFEEENKTTFREKIKNEFQLTFLNFETLPSRSNVEVNIEEPSVLFTGRATDLLNLHSLLFSSDWQDLRRKYVWLYGLKGVGKSETVRNYIQIHKTDYDRNIIWIDCSSHEKIRKSFEDFFIVVNQKNTNEIDLKELDTKSLAINSYKLLIKSKSLIVFDNVQHTSDILHIMPPQTLDLSTHFSVVITSRKTTKVTASNNGINYIKLDFLNSEEATVFARKLFRCNEPQLVLPETSFELFIESMGCFPLTIKNGVETYFRLKKCCNRTFALDEFLYLFNREKGKLCKEESFLVKSQKILEQIILDVDVGINARKLMEFLIYLGSCKIDLDKLTRLAKEVKGIYSSVDLLCKFSLISNMFINVVLKEAFRCLLQLEKREEEVLGRIIPHHELYEMEAVWNHARKYPKLIKYAYRPICPWSNITPLHLLTGRSDITRDLLRSSRTHKDIIDRFGRKPLDLAILNGHIQTVVEVYGAISLEIFHAEIYAAVSNKNINRLESVLAGIDSKMINQKYGGMSVVHIAVRGSNIDVLNLLIDHKADLNSRNNHGVVPLHIACQHGNLDITKKLIENGAKVSVVDSFTWTPIFYAASNGHQHVLEYFVDNNLVDGKQTDRHGHTILHVASQYGKLNNVQYLLSCCKSINLDINALAVWGNSAIFTAALNGYWDTVDCLLQANADIETFHQNTFIGHLNLSVLHIAAAYDNILLLDKLLKMYDLDPDTGHGFSFTPMYVAQYFQSELVLHCFRNHGYALSMNYENILRTAQKLYNEYDRKQDLCCISYTEFFKNFSKHRLKEIFVYLSPNEFKAKWIALHRFLSCLVDLNTKCMKNVIEKRLKCS